MSCFIPNMQSERTLTPDFLDQKSGVLDKSSFYAVLFSLTTFLLTLGPCDLPAANVHLSQYEMISLLGKGEKAEVFLARDASGHFKAIKHLYPRSHFTGYYPEEYLDYIFALDGSSSLAMRELLIGKKLIHPNILKIESIFTEKDEHGNVHTYLVMEYVDGQTLSHVTDRSQSRDIALQNTLELIDALQIAFKKGFINDDLYSENLMFDGAGHIKIIDLDSFTELTDSDQDDDRTNREYLEGVFMTLKKVYSCGQFSNDELNSFCIKMEAVIADSQYAEQMDLPVSRESLDFFCTVLDDFAARIC